MKRFSKPKTYMDMSLVFIVIFLLCFGLIMVYSASSYEASVDFNGDSTYYLRSQLRATVIGLAVMVIVTRIDYHFWARMAWPAYIVSLILVLLVMTPLGRTINGARRWLNIGGLSLQPAEVTKFCMIIFFATYICGHLKSIKKTSAIMTVFAFAIVPCLMVMVITQNMSSAIIIFGIVYLMLFIASSDVRPYILFALGAVGFAVFIVFFVDKNIIPAEISFRLSRIKAWLNPEAYASGKGYQTLQALYSIGSGGIFGKGLGQSTQKLGFVPEAQNDMIFSIICEELGLFGAIAVIFIFVILIWHIMAVANNAPDLFGSLLSVGVMGHFAIQVVLNIAVVTNTIPNTGITLPFISFGGSSTLFLLAEIGLVLSVSRSIKADET